MNRKEKFLITALFTFIFLIICKTFRDYGITWDEDFHRPYGDFILRWYSSHFKDMAAVQDPQAITLYGGFFDILVQLANYWSPLGFFETRHLLGALFGLWTIFMTYKIARHIAGYLAGFFAALCLVLQPVFYGHMFNNPVDIPFAALFTTTIYCLITTYDQLPRLPPKDFLKLGLSLGLLMGIRVGGIFFILPCIALCWLSWFENQKSQIRSGSVMAALKILFGFIRNLLWILAIAWTVMLVCWPWAQLRPIKNPLEAAFKFARFCANQKNLPILFEGKYREIFEVPKYYLFKSIFITLPEFLLMVLFIGGIFVVFHRLHKSELTTKAIKTGLLIFAFLFPVLAATAFSTPHFDGYRHYLFLTPILAALGGISFATLIHSKTALILRICAGLAITYSVCLTVFDMHRLHPYENVYFNQIQGGGLAKAGHQYETDYWGNSYREGILWVIKNYRPNSKRKIRIMNSSMPVQIDYYIQKTPGARDRFEMAQGHAPDIYLSTTRWEHHRDFPGKALYVVKRDGIPLLYVVEVAKNTRGPR